MPGNSLELAAWGLWGRFCLAVKQSCNPLSTARVKFRSKDTTNKSTKTAVKWRCEIQEKCEREEKRSEEEKRKQIQGRATQKKKFLRLP